MAAAAVSAGSGLNRLVPAAQMRPLFKEMPAGTRYLGYRFTEGSLVFYSHAPWEMTDDARQLKQFLNGGGPRLAVVLETKTKIDRYLRWELNRYRDPSAPLEYKDYSADIDAAATRSYRCLDFKGLNLGRFSWVTLRVYYRSADKTG
jgi:hypothetical protein